MTSVLAQDLVVNRLVQADTLPAAGRQVLRSGYVVNDVNAAAALAAGALRWGDCATP
jgi:hypothetical protein